MTKSFDDDDDLSYFLSAYKNPQNIGSQNIYKEKTNRAPCFLLIHFDLYFNSEFPKAPFDIFT